MVKKQLAKKWHVKTRTIDILCQNKEIQGNFIINSRNTKNLINISQKEIRRFEEKHSIPSDPINQKEALELLGVSTATLNLLVKEKKIKVAIVMKAFRLFSEEEIKKYANFFNN